MGMVAVIYGLMGPLVWYLVNQLKQQEARLYQKMKELESTRERLVAEEKLFAIGRFASGIAHEIRNPVAMITSSLATAKQLSSEPADREEMFGIAVREAKWLERLTGEFLSYARPVRPKAELVSVKDILRHIADVTKMHSSGRIIDVTVDVAADATAMIDSSQIEAALLNLCLNAVDATPDRGKITLRCGTEGDKLRIDVQDSGPRVNDQHVKRIFEPFFTTKSGGTGLGLAIAHGVAVAHGGDLFISNNQDGAVIFTMELPKNPPVSKAEEIANAEDNDCR